MRVCRFGNLLGLGLPGADADELLRAPRVVNNIFGRLPCAGAEARQPGVV